MGRAAATAGRDQSVRHDRRDTVSDVRRTGNPRITPIMRSAAVTSVGSFVRADQLVLGT